MALAVAPPNLDDVEPAANQTRDRLITGVVTVAPIAGLGFVAWQVTVLVEPPVPPIANAIAAPTSSATTEASTIGQTFECSGPIAAWGDWLHRGDLVVFAILYLTTGLGITVGFHRHLTHRAFAAIRPARAVLAVLGSAAIEGPVISWVADHRNHHAFADVEGDPHSPHVGHGRGWRGATAGLLHAHADGCSSTPNAAPGIGTRPTCSQTRSSG